MATPPTWKTALQALLTASGFIVSVLLAVPARADAGTSALPIKTPSSLVEVEVDTEARGSIVHEVGSRASCTVHNGTRPLHRSTRGPWCFAEAHIEGGYQCLGRMFLRARVFQPARLGIDWNCSPSIVRQLWPVEPIDEPHAIHGSFLDVRSEYHPGIDVLVDDSRPADGAPAWASHRIHAVQDGVVSSKPMFDGVTAASCNATNFSTGAFSFWHAVPTVPSGTRVEAGAVVGWTCRGSWHVHVNEKRAGLGVVNPLRPDGVIGPFPDDIAPTVTAMEFFSPCSGVWGPWARRVGEPVRWGIAPCGREIAAGAVEGLVDLRFSAHDDYPGTMPPLDTMPYMYEPLHPYAAVVSIVDAATGNVVFEREIWRALQLGSQADKLRHFAPGMRRWSDFGECTRLADHDRCQGTWWYRAFTVPGGDESHWDSTTVPNGRYVASIRLLDRSDNEVTRTLPFTVANPANPAPAGL